MTKITNSSREDFRARAAECRVKVECALSEAARGRYLDSAERWTQLALSYQPSSNTAPEQVPAPNPVPDRHAPSIAGGRGRRR